jgi:transcriptional regulator with XRE-family HTH domain
MANYKSMGEIICTLRKEKGMTQKELADMLSVTDKAVSKWERDVACPDTMTIPKLAEILGVSIEELMNAKSTAASAHKGAAYLLNTVFKAVPIAMGVAVTVTSILGELDLKSGFVMLGIGLACLGVYLLNNKE